MTNTVSMVQYILLRPLKPEGSLPGTDNVGQVRATPSSLTGHDCKINPGMSAVHT